MAGEMPGVAWSPAELHASIKGDLRDMEGRICARIDAHRAEIGAVERRVGAAEILAAQQQQKLEDANRAIGELRTGAEEAQRAIVQAQTWATAIAALGAVISLLISAIGLGLAIWSRHP